MDKSHKVSGADGRIWSYSCLILNVIVMEKIKIPGVIPEFVAQNQSHTAQFLPYFLEKIKVHITLTLNNHFLLRMISISLRFTITVHSRPNICQNLIKMTLFVINLDLRIYQPNTVLKSLTYVVAQRQIHSGTHRRFVQMYRVL